MFVIDISGSVEENNGFDLERSFMKELIYGLSFDFGRTRVGFVTFARNPQIRFYLDKYRDAVAQQDILNALVIDTVGFETNIASAIQVAGDDVFRSTRGDRPGSNDNVMILVSDGKNTIVSDSDTLNQASEVRGRGIQLYTVAVGENSNIGLMEQIASKPSSTYYHVIPTRSDVSGVVSNILENLCL